MSERMKKGAKEIAGILRDGLEEHAEEVVRRVLADTPADRYDVEGEFRLTDLWSQVLKELESGVGA